MAWPVRYLSTAALPARIAIFPLAGAIVLPRTLLPLNVFEPRYLEMVDHAMSGSRVIGMVQPFEPGDAKPAVYPVGCAARIVSYVETNDGRFMISLAGICRFRIAGELDVATAYRQVVPDYAPFAADLAEVRDDHGVDRNRVIETLREYVKGMNLNIDWASFERAPVPMLVNTLSMICPFAPQEKQALVEAVTLAERADVLLKLMELAAAARSGGGVGSVQ